MTKRLRVFVSGRVQGVFFRSECATRADRLGLGGFARNLPDGRVEAVFEGEDDRVDQMVRWCHEGSSWSRVEHVEATEEEPTGDRDFRIK